MEKQFRVENGMVSPLERIKNYKDFHLPLDKEERLAQASRCHQCGVPFCQSALQIAGATTGCPLHNLIPEWNEHLYLDNLELAFTRLMRTNPFAEFTSRVCPALCEKACINLVHEEATTIHDNENYIIESAYANGWMKPNPPETRTDKKVAIIGSGPSGLSAAYWLNQRGHDVTVFEREDRPGGLLEYGIPNMKLEKEIVQRRTDLMEEEGITFKCNQNLGDNLKLEDLADYDAIVLALGSKKPRELSVEKFEGIIPAVDYLKESTKSQLEHRNPNISAKGKKVVILGGGDTGNDCMGTAIRQEAAEITQLEMTSKKPAQRPADNPWPEWPRTDKIDYGLQEAMALYQKDPRRFNTTISKTFGKDGKLSAIEIVRLDPSFKPIKGSEQILDCDLLIIAAGFIGIEDYVKEELDLPLSARNTIITKDDGYQSQVEGLFACGDCHRGQSLVVWALKEGKDCAREVDQYLMGYSNIDSN